LNQTKTGPRFVHRLRGLSIVRLLIFCLVLAGTTIAATIVTRLLVPPAPSPMHEWVLLKNLLLPVLLLFAYAATVRWLEHRRASELALKAGLALFPAGLLTGLAIISGYVLVLVIADAAQVKSGIASAGNLPTSFWSPGLPR
jgi:hypothetical protein